MTATTSAQVLMKGALSAVQSGDSSGADALFQEYLGAMSGTLPHAAMVEVDLPGLQKGVTQSLASKQNNGAWWAKLDADTAQRVDAFFGLLQQAAARIDQLEPPVTDPKQLSARIDENLATLGGLMDGVTTACQELARMGNVKHWEFDQNKVNDDLETFRTMRRQAAEILIPMGKLEAQMSEAQRSQYRLHHDQLLGMIHEVRSVMMLNG
jgi:hypothetical protein